MYWLKTSSTHPVHLVSFLPTSTEVLNDQYRLILLSAIYSPGCSFFDVLLFPRLNTPSQTHLPSQSSASHTTHTHHTPDPVPTSFAGFATGPLLSIFHGSARCLTGQQLCSANQVRGSLCLLRTRKTSQAAQVSNKEGADAEAQVCAFP